MNGSAQETKRAGGDAETKGIADTRAGHSAETKGVADTRGCTADTKGVPQPTSPELRAGGDAETKGV